MEIIISTILILATVIYIYERQQSIKNKKEKLQRENVEITNSKEDDAEEQRAKYFNEIMDYNYDKAIDSFSRR